MNTAPDSPLPASAQASRMAPSAQTRWVLALSMAQLVSWGSVFYGFSVLMEPMEQSLGMGRSQSSAAFSLALLAEGLMAYPVGRWIDRGHERRVMASGSLWLALCLLALSQVSSGTAVLLVWTAMGLGMAATLYTPAFAVLTRRFPGDFRRAIITMTFVGGLASTVFLPLTDALVHALGWRTALWWLAAMHLGLCLPLHVWLLRNAPPDPAAAHPAPAAASGTRPEPSPLQPPSPPPPRNAWVQHARSQRFVLVGAFVVLSMAVTASLPPHMVSLLRSLGLDASWAIALPAAIGVMQVAGRVLLFALEHRFDTHTSNRLIPLLLPLGLLALLLASGVAPMGAAEDATLLLGLVLLFVLLWGMGNGMLTIVKGTVVAEYVNRTHVATLNGALGLPLALARAAAPLLLGLLWTPAHGYRDGLLLMLALIVLGWFALVAAQRRQAALPSREPPRSPTA